MQYRQGDLLFVRIGDAVEDGAPGRFRKLGAKVKHVLAIGEAPGHAHVLEAHPWAKVFEQADAKVIELPTESEAVVKHPDHATLTLPPGRYKVIRQREDDTPITENRSISRARWE